jgi:23S rRNA (pseudouridine1915-N3)-methyltransferase
VSILAVGKLKEAYSRQAAPGYARPQTPNHDLSVSEFGDRDHKRRGRARALDEEGADLLKWLARRASGDMRVIALTPEGRQRGSEEFSRHIEALKVAGCSHLVFIVGGPGGLSEEVLAAADEQLSLGTCTWPHDLARVLLLEQLYRACRIAEGHPYHR